MLDWFTNSADPLAFPGAEAAASSGLHPAHVNHFLENLRNALIETDTLSVAQVERFISSVSPLAPHGILIVPLESSAVPLDTRCAFIEEIFDTTGQRIGTALLSGAHLSTHSAADESTHTLLLLGLSRPIARVVARHLKHRLQGEFGALCGVPAMMQRWHAFGSTLNVEHVRRDGPENAFILPNALATRPPDAPMVAPTFIFRDPDDGIHREITLQIVSPDRSRWLPLSYLRENWLTTHDTNASAVLVYLSHLSRKGRYAYNWNENVFQPGEFSLQLSETPPYVAVRNRSHTIRWTCGQSGCSVFMDDASGDSVSAYLDPLSVTWHASTQHGPSRLTHDEEPQLPPWRVESSRDYRYIEVKQPFPDSGPLFAVHHANDLAEAPPLHYVAEVAGALFPTRFSRQTDGTFHCEIYNLQDPTTAGLPVTWDGNGWQLEQTAATPPTPCETPPHGDLSHNQTVATHAPPHPEDHHRQPDEGTPIRVPPFQVVDTFCQKLNTTFPSLYRLANTTLHEAVLNDHHVDLDPDRTWFMRFDLAQSDSLTITGWAHVGPPVEARPLTECLLTNFPASAQEHPWILDQLSGVYRTNASATHHFDSRNEVRLRPSQLMQTVWQIDFYHLAKTTLEHAWQRPDLQDMNNGVALSVDLSNARLEAADRDGILASVDYLNTTTPATPSIVTINRYSATDLLVFDTGDRVILYMPRHANPNKRFAVFESVHALQQGIASMCADPDQRVQIARHFSQLDRQDHATYDGVDRWLETLSGPGGASYQARIGYATELLHGQPVFHALAERQRQRALSDLDTLIQSDAEVRKAIWVRYIDAINVVLPNPFTPFASLGMHIDQALNGDTYEERMAGVRAIVSDSGNLALMAVLESLTVAERTGFALDGAAFHENVREQLATLSQASAIEWDGQRWAVEHDTSSHVSTKLKASIAPDMYAREVHESTLVFPDIMGLRQAANGQSYLKINGRFVEIRQLAGAPNRYYINSHPKFVLRFQDGQFRPETSAERLAVIRDVGLGGRQGKLKIPLAPTFVPTDLTDIPMTPYLTTISFPPHLLRVLDGKSRLGRAEKQLRIEVRERADKMDIAAKDFFGRLAPVSHNLAPPLETGLSDMQTFEALFRRNTGIVIGEYHTQPESKLLLVDNMSELKRQGVQTLYLEGLVEDLHEADLAAYFSSPDASMPAALQVWSDQIARGNRIDPTGPGTYRALLEAARANEIQVKALDCTATVVDDELSESTEFLTADAIDGTQRLRKMNYFGSAVIRQHQSATGNEKWIALVGAGHINTLEGVPTVSDLTDAVGVWIKVKPRYRHAEIQPGHTLKRNNRGFDYVWKRPPTGLRPHRHGAGHKHSQHRLLKTRA
ncbi:membrane-targeted effector domain-containing toxin (plasmid) [Burkholderia pyrrocinia]|uniref:membrane-targeted effector domain-containing toxin n=1 Tax=Burkholderia pyrrocinia TaxID=60550 RepID=UPI0038B4B693